MQAGGELNTINKKSDPFSKLFTLYSVNHAWATA